jgi:hypothetical protein
MNNKTQIKMRPQCPAQWHVLKRVPNVGGRAATAWRAAWVTQLGSAAVRLPLTL